MSIKSGVREEQLATQAQNEATGYRQQAAGAYGTVGNEGQKQYDQYNNLLQSLLPQYEANAGISGASQGGPTGAGMPAGSSADVSQGTNPYQLTDAQQQQLNSQIDLINRAHQTAQQQLQQHAAAQGFVDPNHYEANLQNLNQMHAQTLADHVAAFHENTRQQNLASIMNLANFSQGGLNTGIGAQEGSASGIAGLGGQAQTASSQNQAAASQKQAQTAGILSSVGNGLFQLGGAAVGGAFSGSGGSGSNATSGSAPFDWGAALDSSSPSGSTVNWANPSGPVSVPTNPFTWDPNGGSAY